MMGLKTNQVKVFSCNWEFEGGSHDINITFLIKVWSGLVTCCHHMTSPGGTSPNVISLMLKWTSEAFHLYLCLRLLL